MNCEIKYDIFLSYKSQDETFVKQVEEALVLQGRSCFSNAYDVLPDQKLAVKLERVVRECQMCLFFVGSNELGKWRIQELSVALNRMSIEKDFQLIPILVPNTNIELFKGLTLFPKRISPLHWSIEHHEIYIRILRCLWNRKDRSLVFNLFQHLVLPENMRNNLDQVFQQAYQGLDFELDFLGSYQAEVTGNLSVSMEEAEMISEWKSEKHFQKVYNDWAIF